MDTKGRQLASGSTCIWNLAVKRTSFLRSLGVIQSPGLGLLRSRAAIDVEYLPVFVVGVFGRITFRGETIPGYTYGMPKTKRPGLLPC